MGKYKHSNMDNKEKKTNEEMNRQENKKTDEQNIISEERTEQTSTENGSNNDQVVEQNPSDEEITTTDATKGQENEDPLKKAEVEVENMKDKYLRKVAEFENYRKRTIKEKAELILNGSERTLTAILPVVDDMERAITNADKIDDIKAMKEGMNLIYQKFQKTLESLGLKRMETEGADFDTDFHEAIAMVPGMGEDKKGKVLDCVQTGYKLNDKVIRHAKVAVGQ
jgi:molecular chaperone GrpE